jgi:DNA-binding transcriptional MerR regulator
MDLRVEQLAARTGTSVDTVRFYQSKGLLPAPRREGRIALYGDEHVIRIERIKALQGKGFTLAAIGRLLSGDLDAADEALVVAMAGGREAEDVFDLDELSRRSGIPTALLRAVAKEGLLVPLGNGWTQADVDVARGALQLLEHGLPLPEVLALARRHHAAMRSVAEEAVALFDEHVRTPLRTAGLPDDEAAARLVEAFESLLPATTKLVAHHFRRVLLAVAQEHIDAVGDDAERSAVQARRLEIV